MPKNKVLAEGPPAANIMDHVPMLNILPFGVCLSPANPMVAAATAAALGVLTPMPCIPMAMAPWMPGAPKAGDEIWTDNYGRIEVQFHWDREGHSDETRPCWVRMSRCTESESDGRMIDAILTNTMLPDISKEFLVRMMVGMSISGVRVAAAEAGGNYVFS